MLSVLLLATASAYFVDLFLRWIEVPSGGPGRVAGWNLVELAKPSA